MYIYIIYIYCIELYTIINYTSFPIFKKEFIQIFGFEFFKYIGILYFYKAVIKKCTGNTNFFFNENHKF